MGSGLVEVWYLRYHAGGPVALYSIDIHIFHKPPLLMVKDHEPQLLAGNLGAADVLYTAGVRLLANDGSFRHIAIEILHFTIWPDSNSYEVKTAVVAAAKCKGNNYIFGHRVKTGILQSYGVCGISLFRSATRCFW